MYGEVVSDSVLILNQSCFKMDAWSLVYLDESNIPLNYKCIYEYLTNFFIDFNAGKENTHCLKTCRRNIDQRGIWGINVPSLRPTAQTLDSMFECICDQLFHHRCGTDDIMILLAFSIEFDKCFEKESWYSLEILIETMTKQLVIKGFDPATMEDHNGFHCSYYLLIVPMLFLVCFILKLTLYKQQ